jgi:hypothetical protein
LKIERLVYGVSNTIFKITKQDRKLIASKHVTLYNGIINILIFTVDSTLEDINENKDKRQLINTLDMHSLALYKRISDMRLIAMENGMMVCSQLVPLVLWLPPVQRVQNTVSQVSQNSSSCNM